MTRDKFNYMTRDKFNYIATSYMNIGGHGYGKLPKVVKPFWTAEGGGKKCAVWCSTGVLDTYCCQYEDK